MVRVVNAVSSSAEQGCVKDNQEQNACTEIREFTLEQLIGRCKKGDLDNNLYLIPKGEFWQSR